MHFDFCQQKQVASTFFFMLEAQRLSGHWRTSLTVGSLVTLVAAVHYFYMREFWVTYFASPIVYRYIVLLLFNDHKHFKCMP